MSEQNQNDSNTANTGMSEVWTKKMAEDLPAESEAQRFARTALINIAATLLDLTKEQAMAIRQEYCNLWPKAKVESDKVKSRGTDDSMLSTAKWPSTMRPPLLREFNMASDLVYKLRKLGILNAEDRLSCRFDAVKEKHAAQYAGRE